MKPGGRTAARITGAFVSVVVLLTLTAGAASAGTVVPRARPATAPPGGNGLAYAAHTQMLSANGTTSSAVTCPPGTLPVGGGTGVQNPRIEHVAQAGFTASAATGKVDGYEASVRVSGLARGARVQFAVQVACVPAALASVIYPVHTQVLSARNTTWWAVFCPTGTLPVGGGTRVQDPRIERVAQAGFTASIATGRADGYEASVGVSGPARAVRVRFTVQVACVPSATTFVIYGLHTQVLSARGTSSSGVVCPVGTEPVGGGAAVQDPLVERVAQAGFTVSAASGKVDGYEASVRVSDLARKASVRFAVQVACIRAASPPVFGPPTMTRSAQPTPGTHG